MPIQQAKVKRKQKIIIIITLAILKQCLFSNYTLKQKLTLITPKSIYVYRYLVHVEMSICKIKKKKKK